MTEVSIHDFINVDRVVIDLCVSNRKRLFDHLAKLISPHDNEEEIDAILHVLTKREKLGCTGIGKGIALPHGRIESFTEPVIAIARLRDVIHYDAPDEVPIWLAVCLLVPSENQQLHLQLLASLAERFEQPNFIEKLKRARSASELVECF